MQQGNNSHVAPPGGPDQNYQMHQGGPGPHFRGPPPQDYRPGPYGHQQGPPFRGPAPQRFQGPPQGGQVPSLLDGNVPPTGDLAMKYTQGKDTFHLGSFHTHSINI